MSPKIILSTLSIFASLTLVGTGAYAAFSSTASNNGNTFGAGSLTLAINGFGGSGSPAKFTIANAGPGDVSPFQLFDLSNVGSVAVASVKLTSIDVTPTGPVNLGDKLTLDLYNDIDGDGIFSGPDTLIKSAHLTDGTWSSLPMGFGLTPSGTHGILARIIFDSDANDTYQGAGVSFNLNFQGDQ